MPVEVGLGATTTRQAGRLLSAERGMKRERKRERGDEREMVKDVLRIVTCAWHL